MLLTGRCYHNAPNAPHQNSELTRSRATFYRNVQAMLHGGNFLLFLKSGLWAEGVIQPHNLKVFSYVCHVKIHFINILGREKGIFYCFAKMPTCASNQIMAIS